MGDRGRKYVLSENYGFHVGYDFNEDQRLTYKFVRSNYDWEYKDPSSYVRDKMVGPSGRPLILTIIPWPVLMEPGDGVLTICTALPITIRK